MIIAKNPPKPLNTKVYVSDTEYQIWVTNPICLGVVRKVGHRWYTPDARSFKSARLAMLYMSRAHAEGRILQPKSIPAPITRPKKPKISTPLGDQLKLDIDTNDPLVISVLKLLAEHSRRHGPGTDVH